MSKSLWRIFLVFFWVAGIACAPVFGEESLPDEVLEGEILVWGIPVGRGSVEIWNNAFWEGRPARRIVAKGETAGLFALFYRVNDTMESFCQPGSCLPYAFRVHFEEGKYRRKQEFRFDQPAGVITGAHGSVLKTTPPTYDPLSAILFLRGADLQEGIVLHGNVSDGRQVYRMEACVPKKEMKNVLGQRMPCWVVEPKMEPVALGGMLKNQKFRQFTAWMTADEERILVLAKGDLFLGCLEAKLKRRQAKSSAE